MSQTARVANYMTPSVLCRRVPVLSSTSGPTGSSMPCPSSKSLPTPDEEARGLGLQPRSARPIRNELPPARIARLAQRIRAAMNFTARVME